MYVSAARGLLSLIGCHGFVVGLQKCAEKRTENPTEYVWKFRRFKGLLGTLFSLWFVSTNKSFHYFSGFICRFLVCLFSSEITYIYVYYPKRKLSSKKYNRKVFWNKEKSNNFFQDSCVLTRPITAISCVTLIAIGDMDVEGENDECLMISIMIIYICSFSIVY